MEAERAANISRNNRALADFGLAPDALPRPLAPGRGARPACVAHAVWGWALGLTLGWRVAYTPSRSAGPACLVFAACVVGSVCRCLKSAGQSTRTDVRLERRLPCIAPPRKRLTLGGPPAMSGFGGDFGRARTVAPRNSRCASCKLLHRGGCGTANANIRCAPRSAAPKSPHAQHVSSTQCMCGAVECMGCIPRVMTC